MKAAQRSAWRAVGPRWRERLIVLALYAALSAVGHLLWEIVQLPLYALWRTASRAELAFAVFHCTGGDILIATNVLLIGCPAPSLELASHANASRRRPRHPSRHCLHGLQRVAQRLRPSFMGLRSGNANGADPRPSDRRIAARPVAHRTSCSLCHRCVNTTLVRSIRACRIGALTTHSTEAYNRQAYWEDHVGSNSA